MRWMWVIIGGLVLGVAAAASDLYVLQHGTTAARAWALVLNAGWTWAALSVWSGWLIRHPAPALVAGMLGALVAVIAYYVFAGTVGDRVHLGVAGLLPRMERWSMVALIFGPFLGLIGALTRRRGVIGLLAALVVPIGAAIEFMAYRHFDRRTFEFQPVVGPVEIGMTAIALCATLIAVVVGRLHPRG